jgi:hypothetical protein
MPTQASNYCHAPSNDGPIGYYYFHPLALLQYLEFTVITRYEKCCVCELYVL